MTINIPTTRKETSDKMLSDVKSRLPDSNPFLRDSYLQSLIFGFSGRVYDNYQKINIMIKQFFPDTAEDEFINRWGFTYGISKNAATQSKGLVTFTGTNANVIPDESTLQNSIAVQFNTQSDATLSTQVLTIDSISRSGSLVTVNFTADHNLASGVVIDSIAAVAPSDFNTTNIAITVTSTKQFQYNLTGTAGAGAGGSATWTTASVEVKSITSGANTNIGNGGSLTLTVPISGVDSTSYVQFTEIAGGADEEGDAAYLQRILDRIQKPFSFFNTNALANQAKLITGVTRVYVFSPDTTSGSKNITSITRNGQIATVNAVNHALVDGSFVTITGAVQNEYNVIEQRVIVIDNDNFAYVVSGSPTSPATGTIFLSFSFVELGQVRVYPLRDNDENIIPSSGEINDIKEELLKIKPAHIADVDLIVQAPIAVSIPLTFSSLSPNTSEMQLAINNSVDGFFRSANIVGNIVKLADLQGLVSSTIDSTGARPIYTLSAPSTDTTIDVGEIGIKGIITFP
jgi:uncharacterized phage protein gp47/JayE